MPRRYIGPRHEKCRKNCDIDAVSDRARGRNPCDVPARARRGRSVRNKVCAAPRAVKRRTPRSSHRGARPGHPDTRKWGRVRIFAYGFRPGGRVVHGRKGSLFT
jgi:hypothetical protein